MSSPVRIGYLSDFAPRKLGTGEARLVAFAREAGRRGHAFTLYGREPVHPEVATALRAAGATWRPLADLEARPWRAGRRLAAEHDVLELNMIAPRSRAALAAALAWPARVLFVDRVSGGADDDHDRGLMRRVADRLTMVRVHQLAGISTYVTARAARRFGLSRSRVLTIHNGVDADRFHPAEPPSRRAAEPFAIIVVANLIPAKGVDVLLRAVGGLAGDWRLRVVGDGPESAGLRALAGELGIEQRVEFLGLRSDVDVLLRQAHAMVHPATWREALGNTVLEGMATGLAVVASDVGGIPDMISDEVHGLLVPPGDVEGLTAALTRLQADPTLRQRLGRDARNRVEAEFTLERSVGEHLGWIEAACRLGGSAARPRGVAGGASSSPSTD